MSQQLGSEVERHCKANKSTTPRTALSRRAALGGIQTHCALPTELCTRATQLVVVRIYNTTQQHKANLKPLEADEYEMNMQFLLNFVCVKLYILDLYL